MFILKMTNNPTNIRFGCIRCGAEFARLRDYHKHTHRRALCGATRTTELPNETNYVQVESSFKCDICDKTFVDISTLERHNKSRVHQVEVQLQELREKIVLYDKSISNSYTM
jgi:uncharacterized C2H2 Zn-finger protein